MIVVIFTVSTLLTIIEGGSWLLYNHVQPSTGLLNEVCKEFYMYTRKVIQLTDIGVHDKELGYVLKPGHHKFSNLEFEHNFTVNSLGVRGDERDLKQPDFVILGDSYAMGWGVEDAECFPKRLEKKLNRKVLNLAISSYGTSREFEILKRSKVKPKAIIIQYCRNDLDENLKFISENYQLETMSQQSYEDLKIYHEKISKYFPFKYTRKLFVVMVRNYKRKLLNKTKRETRDIQKEGDAFLDIIKYYRKDFPITPIYVLELNTPGLNFNNGEFISYLNQHINKNELKYLKTVSLHEEMKEKEFFYIYDDHLRAVGHEYVASKLYNSLKSYPFKYLQKPGSNTSLKN